jgi:MoaA/NifB/PqqE/SkfB family radical SAM enzyme
LKSWKSWLRREDSQPRAAAAAASSLAEEPARDRIWYGEPETDYRDFSGAKPPSKLMFTLTGKCNLRCAHCARGVLDIPSHETSPALVNYVIDNLLPNLQAVRLGGTDLGEQLIARQFEPFLEAVARHPQVDLEIISNLSVVTERKAELIAQSCRHFGISIEGTGEFFEANRGFPWPRLVENVRTLQRARARTPDSPLKIFALVTCYYDNLAELPRILDLHREGVDLFRFRLFRPTDPTQDHQALEAHRSLANAAFARLRERAAELGAAAEVPPDFPLVSMVEMSARARGALKNPVAAPAPRAPFVCHFPFETASIFSDGMVSPCCESLFLGTLDREKPDLVSLFRSDNWVELRRQVAERDFRGPCVNCEFRRSRE